MNLPLSPSHRRSLALAAALASALGLSLAAAPAAQAFTMDTQTNTKADGSARYTDPDERYSGFSSSNGQTTIREGNTSLQFGQPKTFDQRYDANRFFDPLNNR